MYMYVYFLSLLLFQSCYYILVIGSASETGKKQSSILSSTSSCADCGISQNKLLNEFLREEKIAHRLDYIRRQLSNVLHFNNNSYNHTSNIEPLPDFVIEKLINRDKKNQGEDSTFRQMILFPEEEIRNCHPMYKNYVCLKFKLSETFLYMDIESATFWLNTKTLSDTKHQNDTVLSRRNLSSNSANEIHSLNSFNRDGWIQINVTKKVKSWQTNYHNSKYGQLMISCRGCENIYHKNFTRDKTNKPFLQLNMEIKEKLRSKRGADCSPESNNECCRDNLEIDFHSLGDYQMITYPTKFNAYVCRGSCSYHSAVDSHSVYATVIQKLKLNNQSLPSSCCTPLKYSSLTVIYATDESNNNYQEMNIPNMIVESCGCI